MKRFFLLFSLFFTAIIWNSAKATEVLIVGGGPTGLATAIEVHYKGASVTIVEKREGYSRSQFVFLLESTLDLLDKWEVVVPQLKVMDFGEEKMGVVRIKYLERGLNERIKARGIKKIRGDFLALEEGKRDALVAVEGEHTLIPYDFIIAADGAHSQVRDKAGIKCECLGRAVGVWMFVPFSDHFREIDISPILKRENYFIRRISIPMGSIIFLQSFVGDTTLFAKVSLKSLKKKVEACEWFLEAEKLETEPIIFTDNVQIAFQKAKAFSLPEKNILVLGDAAATASFFHGMGVNTSLQTAVLAGEFFQEPYHENAHARFNQKMRQLADQLINFARFLFEEEPGFAE